MGLRRCRAVHLHSRPAPGRRAGRRQLPSPGRCAGGARADPAEARTCRPASRSAPRSAGACCIRRAASRSMPSTATRRHNPRAMRLASSVSSRCRHRLPRRAHGDWSIFKRASGERQWMFRGKPLYRLRGGFARAQLRRQRRAGLAQCLHAGGAAATRGVHRAGHALGTGAGGCARPHHVQLHLR